MISCGRSGWLAQNLAMLLGIPAYRRSHFERGLAECSILCLLFSLSSRCFVMRCQTELPWIAWTGPPTASPKCYAKDQARDTLRIGRDWPVKPVIHALRYGSARRLRIGYLWGRGLSGLAHFLCSPQPDCSAP